MERFAVGAWQPSSTPPAWLSEEQRAEGNEDLNTFLKNPQDFKTLGNEAFNKGQFYRALELYDQALTRLDTFETEESQQLGLRASLHYSRACAHYKVKNFKLAAQQAGECLQIDPGHQKAVKIMQELAPNLLAAQRKPTAEVAEALEDTMQERTSEHRLVKGLLQMKDDANAALVRGNVQEAVRMYNKTFSRMEEVKQEVGLVALDSSQLKATLYANRSQAHISLGQWKEAKADACSCLEIQPGHPKALHRLKLAEDGLSKIQATTDHGEALKNALFYKNTGNKQFGEGHNKAAVEDYTSGLDWLEDLPSDDAAVHDVRIALYSNRALAYLKLKAWSNAVGDADHILSLDPSHRKAKFRRAKALTEMGIFHEAIVELRALSDADPNNEDISEALRHAEAQARVPLDFADAEEMVPDARDAVAERRKNKKGKEHGSEFQVECKRLLQESEVAYAAEKFSEALQTANGAVGHLEAALQHLCVVEDPRQREIDPFRSVQDDTMARGNWEAEQLLSAYRQKAEVLFALREVDAARETAGRASKLFRWHEARLEQDFNEFGALSSSASLVQQLQAATAASEALVSAESALRQELHIEATSFATRALAALESSGWPRRAHLCADLYAVRGSTALRRGQLDDAEADALRALSLDINCRAAQLCMQELRERRLT